MKVVAYLNLYKIFTRIKLGGCIFMHMIISAIWSFLYLYLVLLAPRIPHKAPVTVTSRTFWRSVPRADPPSTHLVMRAVPMLQTTYVHVHIRKNTPTTHCLKVATQANVFTSKEERLEVFTQFKQMHVDIKTSTYCNKKVSHVVCMYVIFSHNNYLRHIIKGGGYRTWLS